MPVVVYCACVKCGKFYEFEKVRHSLTACCSYPVRRNLTPVEKAKLSEELEAEKQRLAAAAARKQKIEDSKFLAGAIEFTDKAMKFLESQSALITDTINHISSQEPLGELNAAPAIAAIEEYATSIQYTGKQISDYKANLLKIVEVIREISDSVSKTKNEDTKDVSDKLKKINAFFGKAHQYFTRVDEHRAKLSDVTEMLSFFKKVYLDIGPKQEQAKPKNDSKALPSL